MYIKISNGIITKYPYSIENLKQDNPQTSFPTDISEEVLSEWGVFCVEATPTPSVGLDKKISEGQPELVNGTWKQVWVISNAPYETHLAKVLFARASEYPSITDYLDGIVKEDNAQVQKYIEDCLAVKAKYPKPPQEQ